jgi:hypothetical protein
MWIDPKFGSTTVADPITDESTTFHGYPEHKWLAHTHEKIAREYALKITEVYDMAQLVAGYAIFGEAALEVSTAL